MNAKKIEDVKDTAIKLNVIRDCSPEDYFYTPFSELCTQ